MATQGPNGTGTGANDTSVGSIAWANPGNITADDANYAIASAIFSNPGQAQNNNTYIVQGGVIGGTNKAANTAIGTTDTFYSFGGSADLWGLTWTENDINATTFGAVLSLKDRDSVTTTNYIKATNFGFSIPAGATIDGILVEFKLSTVACFLSGTFISTPHKGKKIEKIKLGDIVVSFNEKTGLISKNKVVGVKKSIAKEIWTIKTKTTSVSCTGEHRFFTGSEFVEAKNLKIGQVVKAYNGNNLVDDKIVSIRKSKKNTSVYNLQVETDNTYIANGLAVHNFKLTSNGRCNYVRITITYTGGGGGGGSTGRNLITQTRTVSINRNKSGARALAGVRGKV